MGILKIPVTKAGQSIELDTNDLPEDVYMACLAEGLKALVNRRMSKVLTKDLEGEKLADAQAEAMKIATANLEELKAGTVKRTRTAAKDSSGNKVSGVVMTEARRLAKEVVKNEIRAAGMKISHVEASEITKIANAMIADDPSYIETAKANIEARAAKIEKGATDEETKSLALAKLNALGGLTESPKLIERAAKAKAEAKSVLSAKQSGKVAKRKPVQASV